MRFGILTLLLAGRAAVAFQFMCSSGALALQKETVFRPRRDCSRTTERLRGSSSRRYSKRQVHALTRADAAHTPYCVHVNRWPHIWQNYHINSYEDGLDAWDGVFILRISR